MRVLPTSLPDVMIFETPIHSDDRGSFAEVFHAEKFAALGLSAPFVQDNHSRSFRHVLRGLHYQSREPQGKLLRAVRGHIFDVAVDLRRTSPTFGRWTGVELRGDDGQLLWIPEGFAHGFLVLSEEADVSYKCTAPYRPAFDRSIRWNDPAIGIEWPLPSGSSPRLSAKDAAAPMLAAAELFP